MFFDGITDLRLPRILRRLLASLDPLSGMEAAEGAAEGAAAPQYTLVAKWNKEKFEFELAGTLTVGDVKRELECRTRVPCKRQKLIGLGKKANPDDRFIEVAMGAHGRRRKL